MAVKVLGWRIISGIWGPRSNIEHCGIPAQAFPSDWFIYHDSRFDDLLVELLCIGVTLKSIIQLSLVKMEEIFFLDPNVINMEKNPANTHIVISNPWLYSRAGFSVMETSEALLCLSA